MPKFKGTYKYKDYSKKNDDYGMVKQKPSINSSFYKKKKDKIKENVCDNHEDGA